MDTDMRPHTADGLSRSPLPVTRRAFLQALGLACVCRLRPLAAGFTAIADELARLFRWCLRDTAFVGA